MANPIKGEMAFRAGGQDYVMVLDLNALCEAEPLAPGIMEGVALNSLRAVRAVFWAGLQAKHPDIDQVRAGQIMQALGLKEAGRLIGEGMKLAFGADSEGDDRPQ